MKPALPLSREQICNVVARRGGDIPRVPLFWHKFWGAGTYQKYGTALDEIAATVVDDVVELTYTGPGNFTAPEGADPDYKWAIEPDPGGLERQGITSRHVVSSPQLIDDFLAALPDPSRPEYFQAARETVAAHPGRYCLGWDFFCLFERAWFLFGMEEMLCEMLLHPERMRRLLRGFTKYHMAVMDGFAAAGADAYFTSDDLGMQTGLMFSRRAFRELFAPCYEELAAHCHALGLSFWLHCCGAVTEILPDFIALGVDVLHPLQPHAMDQLQVARDYRGRLTFLAGLDVQYLLPRGTPEAVAGGTRALIDACDCAAGGCLLAASNGIMPETPLENIAAWLHTAQEYGTEHRRQYTGQA